MNEHLQTLAVVSAIVLVYEGFRWMGARALELSRRRSIRSANVNAYADLRDSMLKIPHSGTFHPFDPDVEMLRFNDLVMEIGRWQRQTFPDRTPESCAAHLLKEAQELSQSPRDWQEIADVMHLVIAVADANCIDLKVALQRKFIINRSRRWGAPDASGVIEHLEGNA